MTHWFAVWLGWITFAYEMNHLYMRGQREDLFILRISLGECYHPEQDQGAASVISSSIDLSCGMGGGLGYI